MDVDERLRAARPPVTDAEPDLELLERVMAQPVPRRRPHLAIPAVATAALAVAAFLLLGGNRPDTANALSQAMHWFDPPAGKVLHSVMVDSSGQARESWQDVDHPERSRTVLPGGYELGADGIYEAATNTVYEDDGSKPGKGPDPRAGAAKRAKRALAGGARPGTQPAESKPAEPQPGRVDLPETLPKGDPTVTKVRVLIELGHAAVQGREVHDGVEAWKIALTDTSERAPWVLWVNAQDGKPLAIDDPGEPSRNKAPEHSRWTTYEVLDHADAPLTLTDAHPGARIVKDPAQFDAVVQRMSR